MEVNAKKTSWASILGILILIIAVIFIGRWCESSKGKTVTNTSIEARNAVIEAENRYLTETNGIFNGIKAVYLDFQNSVNDYNQDKNFLTLRDLKIDSITFYSGIYAAVNAFNSLKAPVPASLSVYNQYLSKSVLEMQKAAGHVKNFIKSTNNEVMISEMKAFSDCVEASNGYIETANAELNKLKVGETSVSQTTSQIEKSTETKPTTIIKYNIIHTVNNARSDGGARYYLLTKPIDLSNDNFKDGIKGIVTRFVKIHGNKVSLNIYDKLETLENDYKESEKSNTTVSTAPEYLKDIELHLIAYYDGDLSAGLYLNTLQFFPAYYEDIPEIEKYLEILEFNP
jgi:hypothetical protein